MYLRIVFCHGEDLSVELWAGLTLVVDLGHPDPLEGDVGPGRALANDPGVPVADVRHDSGSGNLEDSRISRIPRSLTPDFGRKPP